MPISPTGGDDFRRDFVCADCKKKVKFKAKRYVAAGSVFRCKACRYKQTEIVSDDAPPVVFACPVCKKKLKAKASAAGDFVRCPGCEEKIRVPVPVPVREQPYVAPPPTVNCPKCAADKIWDRDSSALRRLTERDLMTCIKCRRQFCGNCRREHYDEDGGYSKYYCPYFRCGERQNPY